MKTIHQIFKPLYYVAFSDENLTENVIRNVSLKMNQLQAKAAKVYSTSKTEMYSLRSRHFEFVQKVLKSYDKRLPQDLVDKYLGLADETTDILLKIFQVYYGQDTIVRVKIQMLKMW